RRQAQSQVDLTGAYELLLDHLVGNDAYHHVHEVRRVVPAAPVTVEGGEHHFAVGHVTAQHVRARAGADTSFEVRLVGRYRVERVGANDPGAVEGGDDELQRSGVREVEAHRQVVHNHDFLEGRPDERRTTHVGVPVY